MGETDTIIRPQDGPQMQFLASGADIAIYGGSAGGGKTWALLMEPLRHIGNGQFGALFLRLNTTQIRNQGGLWDESVKLYSHLDGLPRATQLHWKFPSGADIKMAHLEHEKTVFDYQGAQIPLINFDELTHFSEKQFFYMLSRNRSMCGVNGMPFAFPFAVPVAGISGQAAGPALEPPPNLFTDSLATMLANEDLDLRGNGVLEGESIRFLGGNSDVRLKLSAPLTPGRHYVLTWKHTGATAGNIKGQLGGAGSVSSGSFQHHEIKPLHKYFRASSVTAAFTRVQFKPASGYDGTISDIQIYDVTDTHPSNAQANVILNLTDSMGANATSDHVDVADIPFEYDPRCWYLPKVTWGTADVIADQPYPLIEPVVAEQAGRMSPVGAMANEVIDWSASTSGGARPLLVVQAGEPGSGLLGSTGSQWTKDSPETPHGGTAYARFLEMLGVVNGMGPAHDIRAVFTTLGNNDRSGVDYSTFLQPAMAQFVADVRADAGIADLPFIWRGCVERFEDGEAPNYDSLGGLAYRGQRLRDLQAAIDQDSGSPFSIPGVHHVPGPGIEHAWDEGNGDTKHIPDANGWITQLHLSGTGNIYQGEIGGQKIVQVLDA